MKTKNNFKKILIFAHSNIGDVCYDLAVVAPLRKTYPETQISFVTSKKAAGLGKVVSGIDELIVFDKHGGDKGITGYVRFMKKIRRMKFDLAVVLRDMQMHYFLNIPTVLKLKKTDVRNNKLHVAEKYLKLLTRIGIKEQTPEFEFRFSQEQSQFVKDLFSEYKVAKDDLKISIAPLTGWVLKCWPLECWNMLIEDLSREFKAKIFVLGKTGESSWEKKIKGGIFNNTISLIDKTSMEESAVLINNMDLFIGLDTSLLHLASCMKIPTVGLYGATDKEFIYPFFHRSNIVNSQAELSCRPCYPGPDGGSCQVQDKPGLCMEDITPEKVMNKIKQVLKK